MEDYVIKQTCSQCKATKPISEFNVRKESKSGYRKNCKVCQYRVNSEYHRKNKERISVRMKKWVIDNKNYVDEYQGNYRTNNKKERNLSCKKWSLENKEYLKEYHRNYYKDHADHKKEIVKIYRREHPERVQVARYNRTKRIKNNGGIVTEKEWIEIKSSYGNKCLCCGKTNIPLDMDHIVPISLNGKNTKDNIQPLCRLCNASKNAKTIDYRPQEARN